MNRPDPSAPIATTSGWSLGWSRRGALIRVALGLTSLVLASTAAGAPALGLVPAAEEPTGGTITEWTSPDDVTYRIHTFTTATVDKTFLTCSTLDVEYLLVGGGGGGAAIYHSGGGGGGGMLEGSVTGLEAGSYTVTVGSGGAGGLSTTASGGDGGDSSAFGATAIGGGGGGGENKLGRSGGSGGGNGWQTDPSATAGVGTGAQGNAGGSGFGGPTHGAPGRAGGGGGGAGGAGGNASENRDRGNGEDGIGGAGGAGRASSITGTSVVYAGGGGGGAGQVRGAGGTGGGGSGGQGIGLLQPEAGTDGLGGGGGGQNASAGGGGRGGDGIVVIRYRLGTGDCPAASEPTVPGPAIRLSVAPSVAPAGTTVTATVEGGDPGVEILWRLVGPAGTSLAVGSVILDGAGAATFRLTVPISAVGAHSVELVDWGASYTLDVVRLRPTAVRAGGGPAEGPDRGLGIVTALLLTAVLVRLTPRIGRAIRRGGLGA